MKFPLFVPFLSASLTQASPTPSNTPPKFVYDLERLPIGDELDTPPRPPQRVRFWRGSNDGKCPQRCLNENMAVIDMEECIRAAKESGLPCHVKGKFNINGSSGSPLCSSNTPFGRTRFAGLDPPLPHQVLLTNLKSNVTFHHENMLYEQASSFYCIYAVAVGAQDLSTCSQPIDGLENFYAEDLVEIMLNHQYVDFQADRAHALCPPLTAFDYSAEGDYELSIGGTEYPFALSTKTPTCHNSCSVQKALSLTELEDCWLGAERDCVLEGIVQMAGSGRRSTCEGNVEGRGRTVIEVSPIKLPQGAKLTNFQVHIVLEMDYHGAAVCGYEVQSHSLSDGDCRVLPQQPGLPFVEQRYVLVSSDSTLTDCGRIKEYAYRVTADVTFSKRTYFDGPDAGSIQLVSKKTKPWVNPKGNRHVNSVLVHLDYRSS